MVMYMYVYVKALAASFLLNSWPGFDQTETDTPLGDLKNDQILVTLI